MAVTSTAVVQKQNGVVAPTKPVAIALDTGGAGIGAASSSSTAVVVRGKGSLNSGVETTSTNTSSSGNAILATSNPARRRKSGQPKSLPPFVKKLWSTVNDAENKEYIHWTEDGNSFRVKNREMFEKMVLPKYYKHTNFSSFVRQLNMYRFHKVQDVQHSEEDSWKFESPNFKRGREDLLASIVRNKNAEEEDDDISKVMNELQLLRSSLNNVANEVGEIRKNNEELWEANNRYQKQFQMLNNVVVQFLSKAMGNKQASRFDILSSTSPSPRTPQRLLTNQDTHGGSSSSSNNNNLANWNITPGVLESVARISDLDANPLDESSPTNSDRSEDSDEQAQRILNSTLQTDNLALDLASQSKALSAIEDFLMRGGSGPEEQQSPSPLDFNSDEYLNIDDYVTLEPEPKRQRVE